MKRQGWVHRGCLQLGVIAASPLTAAAPSTTPTLSHITHIHYAAAEGCPSEAEFRALIAARGVEVTPTATPPLHVSIELVRRHDGYVGTLSIDAKTGSAPREVASATCPEVAEALAVVAAIAARERSGAGASPQQPEPTSDASAMAATDEHDDATAASVSSASAPSSGAPPESPPAHEPEAQHFRHVAGDSPNWIRPGELHHETHVPAGTLSLDNKLAIDTHAGATFGLLPGVIVPRYDLSARNVIFLSTPGEDPFLLGVVPRIRLSFLGPATRTTNQTSSELMGMQFAMGSCLTPYYDTRGLVLLGCVEYGGNALEVRSNNGAESWQQPAGSGLVAVTVEAEYNLSSWAHLALRSGWEGRVQGDHVIEDPDGVALFRLGGNSAFVSFGLGIHF